MCTCACVQVFFRRQDTLPTDKILEETHMKSKLRIQETLILILLQPTVDSGALCVDVKVSAEESKTANDEHMMS